VRETCGKAICNEMMGQVCLLCHIWSRLELGFSRFIWLVLLILSWNLPWFWFWSLWRKGLVRLKSLEAQFS